MKLFQKLLLAAVVAAGCVQLYAQTKTTEGTALTVPNLVEHSLQNIQEHAQKLSQFIDLEDPNAIAHAVVNLQPDFQNIEGFSTQLNQINQLIAQKDLLGVYKAITELMMNVKKAKMVLPLVSAMSNVTPAKRSEVITALKGKIRELNIPATNLVSASKLEGLLGKIQPTFDALLAKLLEAKFTLLKENDLRKVSGIIKQLDNQIKDLKDVRFNTLVSSISRLNPKDFDTVTRQLQVLP